MAFRFKTKRNQAFIGLPSIPRLDGPEPELLTGSVDGITASAPEERLAKALDKANLQYIFRYTVGAPRGLPGWKEIDFVVLTKGMLYLVEVDTAFTHRAKENQDVLHDAIALNDPELNASGELWPYVLRADGDGELASEQGAQQYVKRTW